MSDDAAYWQRRAEAFEAALARLQKRVLALAEVLPVESLRYLREDAGPRSGGPSAGIFEGWDDTVTLVPSDVETELNLLWKRLGR